AGSRPRTRARSAAAQISEPTEACHHRAPLRAGLCWHIQRAGARCRGASSESAWSGAAGRRRSRGDGRSGAGAGGRWSAPMVTHAEEVRRLASRTTEALYPRLKKDQVWRVTVTHAVPGPSAAVKIVERTLLPVDFA